MDASGVMMQAVHLYLLMRIFINLVDDSGQPRNLRMNVANCINTTQLLNEICKEIGIKKTHTIVSLKSDCKNVCAVIDVVEDSGGLAPRNVQNQKRIQLCAHLHRKI